MLDGQHSVDEICVFLSLSHDEVLDLIEDLPDCHVIVCAGDALSSASDSDDGCDFGDAASDDADADTTSNDQDR